MVHGKLHQHYATHNLVATVNIETEIYGTCFLVSGCKCVEIIFRCRTTYVSVKDRSWGSLTESGNWNGLVGVLQRAEADVAVGPLSYSSSRINVVDFSIPFVITRYPIGIKNPRQTLKKTTISITIPVVVKLMKGSFFITSRYSLIPLVLIFGHRIRQYMSLQILQ